MIAAILVIFLLALSACANNITPPNLELPPPPPPPPQSQSQQIQQSPLSEYLRSIPPTYEVTEDINQLSRIQMQGKYVVVNIPAFELVAYDNGHEVLRSKVIVGKTSAKTPRITTNIIKIKFNPDWTPTPNMIASAIARHKKVPQHTRPGVKNPLGLLKFELDDDMNIYLHDTDKHDLFIKDTRGFSHGCVRVEKYVDLAAWVLNTSTNDIQSVIDSGKTIYRTTNLIPVYIVYTTYWQDSEGKIVHLPDVYNIMKG